MRDFCQNVVNVPRLPEVLLPRNLLNVVNMKNHFLNSLQSILKQFCGYVALMKKRSRHLFELLRRCVVALFVTTDRVFDHFCEKKHGAKQVFICSTV